MMTRILTALCAVALSVGAAQSQTTSPLYALQTQGETFGWEAVGKIDVPKGFCTGTLISSDLVLTAAHCVVDADGTPIDPEMLVFKAGYTNGRAVAVRRGHRIAVPESFVPDEDGNMRVMDIPHDVALIKLTEGISTALAAPFLIYDTPENAAAVSVVSYGSDRNETLSLQRECNLLNRYRGGLMSFDCEVTYGSSGAPVFVRYGNRVRILSLISGGRSLDEGSSVSYGMELPDVVRALKAQLRVPEAIQVTPGVRRLSVGDRSISGARFVRP